MSNNRIKLLVGFLLSVAGAGGVLMAPWLLPRHVTAVTLYVGCAICGIGGMWMLRRQCEQLARRLRQSERLAQELQIRLKVATAEQQYAETALRNVGDAVLVADQHDSVLLANEPAARAFNVDPGQIRWPLEQLVQDPRMVSLLRQARQSGTQRVVEHRIRTAAGERTFRVTLSGVAAQQAPQQRDESSVVAVLHDLTAENEFAQMKNDFVSSVSHELRTPLASIKAYVELLIDGEAQDETTKREFYDVIQHEANRLGTMIDNILSLSRIESGAAEVRLVPVSVALLLREAIESLSAQAKQKQVRIVEQLAPPVYQTLADRDMLLRAVVSLLSNALRHSPVDGAVTVQTTVDKAARKLTVRVCDTGNRIPAKDLPFVFDKFYRAEADPRLTRGAGLGLALVKQIVESVHRGRVFAESQPGKGNCFGCELELCD